MARHAHDGSTKEKTAGAIGGRILHELQVQTVQVSGLTRARMIQKKRCYTTALPGHVLQNSSKSSKIGVFPAPSRCE